MEGGICLFVALCEIKGWKTSNLQSYRKHLKRSAQWRHVPSSWAWDTTYYCIYCMLAELVWKPISDLMHILLLSPFLCSLVMFWALSRLSSLLLPSNVVKQHTPVVGGILGALLPQLMLLAWLSTRKWRGCECRVKAEEEDGEAEEKEIKRERNRQDRHYI